MGRKVNKTENGPPCLIEISQIRAFISFGMDQIWRFLKRFINSVDLEEFLCYNRIKKGVDMKSRVDDKSYITIVKESIATVCKRHREPKIADYESVVADMVCDALELPRGTYNKRQVHSTVYRTIKWLVEHDEMVTDGKKHYWGVEEYEKYRGYEEFKNNVRIEKEKFGLISHNTIAVVLDSNYDLHLSRKALEKFLEKEEIFATFLFENVLIIIFEEFAHSMDLDYLSKAMKSAYQFQHAKKTSKKDG